MSRNNTRILGNKLFMKEVLPGSREENSIIRELKSIFSEYIDWFDIIQTPSLTWFDKECLLECGSSVYKCRALPYTISAEIEGYPVEAVLDNGYIKLLEDREYSIVFIEYPLEIDLVKYIVLELSKYDNVQAIIFYDKNPGIIRCCVVTGDYIYSTYTGSPPPVPVLSIAREDYSEIIRSKCRLRISVKTLINKYSTAKTIVMGINGSKDDEIHLTAHHDHWFTGFSDNLVGLEILYKLATIFSEKRSVYSIVLISYTSRELGGLNYSSWYWSWGSRYYLKTISERSGLDKVFLNINIDAIYDYPIEIYGNPSLKHCIEELNNLRFKYVGFDNIGFDSFSYTINGIPACTFTSFNTMKSFYHTNMDNGVGFKYEVLGNFVENVERLIRCIEEKNVKYSSMIEYMMNTIDYRDSIELRNLLTKLMYLDKLIENEEERVRFITKYFTSFTYIPGLKYEYVSDILGSIKLLKRLMNTIGEYLDRSIEVIDIDNLIASFKITKYNEKEILDILNKLISTRSIQYDRVFEKEVVKYIRSRKE